MADDDREKKTQEVLKYIRTLEDQNDKYRQALSKEYERRNKPNELQKYMDDLGIRNKSDFLELFNKQKAKAEEEDMKPEDLKTIQEMITKTVKEGISEIKGDVMALKEKNENVFENMTKGELKGKFMDADKSKYKNLNAYLESLPDAKKKKVVSDWTNELHKTLQENTDFSFEDGMKHIENYCEDNFGHLLKFEEKKEEEGKKDDKSLNLPANSSTSSKEGVKSSDDIQKKLEGMTDEEKDAFFSKEAEDMVKKYDSGKPAFLR